MPPLLALLREVGSTLTVPAQTAGFWSGRGREAGRLARALNAPAASSVSSHLTILVSLMPAKPQPRSPGRERVFLARQPVGPCSNPVLPQEEAAAADAGPLPVRLLQDHPVPGGPVPHPRRHLRASRRKQAGGGQPAPRLLCPRELSKEQLSQHPLTAGGSVPVGKQARGGGRQETGRAQGAEAF